MPADDRREALRLVQLLARAAVDALASGLSPLRRMARAVMDDRAELDAALDAQIEATLDLSALVADVHAVLLEIEALPPWRVFARRRLVRAAIDRIAADIGSAAPSPGWRERVMVAIRAEEERGS